MDYIYIYILRETTSRHTANCYWFCYLLLLLLLFAVPVLLFSLAYKDPPKVRVSPPADPEGIQAEARAVLDKRQGFISSIEITNPGSGYSTALEPVTVEVGYLIHVFFYCT